MSLFQHSVLNKYLQAIDEKAVNEAWEKFTTYFQNPERQENIRNIKEEEYGIDFLIKLFVNILGYTKNPDPKYNLKAEQKNLTDSKKADGAILFDDNVIAVIELKGMDTTDLGGKVEAQAFGYKNHQPEAVYIITSNFEKLRFYIDNAVDFEEFNLFKLTQERFKILWLCLAKENVFQGIPKKIKDESLEEEELITKNLYRDYSTFKHEIFNSIVELNPKYDKLILFKKTQKLLDRFLFIFFAEDKGLLPPNSVARVIKNYHKLIELDAYKPLYEMFKQYFGYMNIGRKGKTSTDDIEPYNGGLFKSDDILNKVNIDDKVLIKYLEKLSIYDFESEVSVNILGHIFEHSLSEIEEITAELEGQEVDKSKTKRKKDGVYYTPKYITKYIVENTVGKLCEEKKAELGINDKEYEKERKGRWKTTLKPLQNKLEKYRKWLLKLTICDPACGSGAFLIQSLDFLINEHRYIDELNRKLLGHSIEFPNVEKSILENNLYGVDINDEAVEIAKLSLWLRTAQIGRKLTTLSNNIKCGNSLIDDLEIAGEKAFNWESEFSEIFKKGGFDVVIGNPPWGASFNKEEKDYLKNKYVEIDSSTPNSFAYFMGLCYELSTIIGLVIPDSYLLKDFEKTRILFKNGTEKLIWYQNSSVPDDLRPFPNVDHDVVTFIYTKNKEHEKLKYSLRFYSDEHIKEISYVRNKSDVIDEKYFNIYNLLIDENSIKLKKKFIGNDIFSDLAQCHEGIHTGNCRDKLFLNDRIRGDEKPLFYGGKKGDIIDNYYSQTFGWYVDYRKDIIDKSRGYYASLRDKNIFQLPKVYITRTGNPFICFIDENTYASNNFFSLQTKDLANNDLGILSVFVSILNSKFSQYFIRKIIAPRIGKAFVETKIIHLLKLPLPKINKSATEMFKKFVEEMVELKKEFQDRKKTFIERLNNNFNIEKVSRKIDMFYLYDFGSVVNELKKQKITFSLRQQDEWSNYFEENKEKIKRLQLEIDKTDREIDLMVYKLYGLTEREIIIIEGYGK